MEEEDEEYDKFGQELERVQVAMKSFHIGQVSGWDDDAEGLEEEVNPFGKCLVLWTASISLVLNVAVT